LLKVKTFSTNCVWDFYTHIRCVFLLENDMNYDHVLLCTCLSSCLMGISLFHIHYLCFCIKIKWIMSMAKGHKFAQKLLRPWASQLNGLFSNDMPRICLKVYTCLTLVWTSMFMSCAYSTWQLYLLIKWWMIMIVITFFLDK
jgi:hypothetical protein